MKKGFLFLFLGVFAVSGCSLLTLEEERVSVDELDKNSLSADFPEPEEESRDEELQSELTDLSEEEEVSEGLGEEEGIAEEVSEGLDEELADELNEDELENFDDNDNEEFLADAEEEFDFDEGESDLSEGEENNESVLVGQDDDTDKTSESDENQVDEDFVAEGFDDSIDILESEEAEEEFILKSELQDLALDENESEDFDGEDEKVFDEIEEDSVEPEQKIISEENTDQDFEKENEQNDSNKIVNLEYKSFENGGTVVIETETPVEYQVIQDSEKNQVIIQIDDIYLPEKFKRPYITKDFKQDIAAVNAYSDPETGSARFVIQTKRPVEPVIQKEGTSILFATQALASTEGSDQLSEGGLKSEEMGLEQGIKSEKINFGNSGSGTNEQISQNNENPDSGVGEQISQNNQNLNDGNLDRGEEENVFSNDGRFSGEKISIEFFETDIRTIIELITDRYGINLIVDEDVAGKLNIRLRNVPWDQALMVVLKSKHLGYSRNGNILRIAKQSTLAQEAENLRKQIENEKKARLLSEGLVVKYIPVSYSKVNDLSGKLKPFMSKDGKISFDDRNSALVITDYSEYLDRVIQLIKSIDKPPMQVEISAKLVEAREEFRRDVGINWDFSGQNFDLGSQTGQLGATLGGTPNTTGLLFDLSVGTFDIFGDLRSFLGLYETQDKVRVISQPKVVTMNKVPARIQQTTQVPVPQIQQGVAGVAPVTTYNFQDLTLGLEVTPQITFSGDVILEVKLNRAFPGVSTVQGIREINNRSAETTVMVKNGSTAVIGGIYQLDTLDSNRGIPFLKDLPFIGYLFRQKSDQRTKNELLLFLKPKILKHWAEKSIMSKSDNQFLLEEPGTRERANETDLDNDISIDDDLGNGDEETGLEDFEETLSL